MESRIGTLCPQGTPPPLPVPQSEEGICWQDEGAKAMPRSWQQLISFQFPNLTIPTLNHGIIETMTYWSTEVAGRCWQDKTTLLPPPPLPPLQLRFAPKQTPQTGKFSRAGDVESSDSSGLLGVLNHAPAIGGDAGGDLQAGHAPHGGTREPIDTVGADLHEWRAVFGNPRAELCTCCLFLSAI